MRRLPLPPCGAELAERQKWDNLPFYVVICAGMNAWQRAKEWLKSPNDINVLVLPDGKSPRGFNWPVNKCDVVIERLPGPGDAVLTDLIKTLLSSGAKIVVVWDKNNKPRFLKYWAKVA